MSHRLEEIAQQYRAALEEYVTGSSEDALGTAYNIGRHAIDKGLGILDLTAIYQEVLLKVLLNSIGQEQSERVAKAAASFFMESLSPFEMAQRGYQAANATVLALNESLEQRKAAEEAIRRINEELTITRDAAVKASRAKSTFLANMSHELRTPLNAIIGYSEMLQEDAKDGNCDQIVSDLQRIQKAAKHLLTLINDILDFAKVEAGKVELKLSDFDVRELVDDVLLTIQPLLDKNHNRLVTDIQEDLGRMYSDETKLRQVLLNLFSNACKFTEEGNIKLLIRRDPDDNQDWLRFTVADDGIGMTATQMDNLFEEFYQAHTVSQEKYGGTGLGLAISKRFCNLMGGDIVAESTHRRGSVFTVRLPERCTVPLDRYEVPNG